MDTHKKIREHISALSDGALSTQDIELALAALHTVDGEQAWTIYHRIGDVLRAQATPDLSDDFSARLAARLTGEAAPARRQPAAGGAAVAAAGTAGPTAANSATAGGAQANKAANNAANNADGAPPPKPVAAAAP